MFKLVTGQNFQRRFRHAIACIVVLAECAIAAHSAPAPAPSNVILITLDTVRADRMGFLGSQRGLTPNLDTLAAQSIVFSRAYSQVPLTNPSHATILTGTYPQFHHVNDFAIPLTKDLPDLPQILHEHGYATAAFVGAAVLDPRGTAPGFDRGFDTYDADTQSFRPGSMVIEHAMAWLKQHHHGPFFIWVHLYDAHAPYISPEPFKSRYPKEPYDASIAYADSVVGDMLKQVRAMTLYDNTVIALMSDHGEAFGEHGEREHGYFLYDETIHVPLLIKLPAQHFGGKQIEKRAGLVDVAPTILQAVDIPVPPAMQGHPLLPLVQETGGAGESLIDRPVYSETDYPYLAYGWSPLRSLRSNKYLFVEAPRQELYDQSSDPAAEHNLSASSPAVTDTLKSTLDAFRSKTANSGEIPKAIVDAQQVKKLNALGYVATATASSNPSMTETRADPKDKIGVANHITQALRYMSNERYQEAISLVEYAQTQEPNSAIVHRLLGECYVHVENFKDAVTQLRRALQLGSDVATVHYQLGFALFGLEDWAGAETEFGAATIKSPNWPDAHYWLGSTYSRMKRYPDAQKELEATLQAQPDNFPANMELGQVLLIEQNSEKAIAIFHKAAELEPEMSDPHHFLAKAYTKLGREEDARHENAEVKRLDAAENNASK